MIAFKQKCTPKTKQYIDNFITYLRKKIEKKHVFNKKILKRKFSIWKEWYFNPNNLNGFIAEDNPDHISDLLYTNNAPFRYAIKIITRDL